MVRHLNICSINSRPQNRCIKLMIRAWIFILEGLLTVIISLMSYFIMVDFPENAKYLSAEERLLAVERLRAENMTMNIDEPFSWRTVRQAFSDWKTWTSALCLMGMLILSIAYEAQKVFGQGSTPQYTPLPCFYRAS